MSLPSLQMVKCQHEHSNLSPFPLKTELTGIVQIHLGQVKVGETRYIQCILFSSLTLSNPQKTPTAISSLEDSSSSNPAFTHAKELRKEAIADLQKRWRCSIHSKDKDIMCWQSDDGICYELTFQQLGFWAIEIVRL
jgi:hypothetical protein